MTSSIAAPARRSRRSPRSLDLRELGARARNIARALPSLIWKQAELAGVSVMIGAGVVAHAWNLFSYPRYQGDEGVYMSAAWAVAHGQIYPYTYTYGHPPLGWILIAAWCQLTGGFFTFGTAINTGRVLMLVIYALSALFVYLIARKIAGSVWPALLAVALFSFSPLGVYFQREVLLDNFAACWMLLSFYLLVASESRMRWIIASALAFGAAVLSKETVVIFLPVFVYGVWLEASAFQRRYMVTVFGYLTIALPSLFVLAAALKNELFPSGTLLGGSNPHVSMIETFFLQAGRGSNQGSFEEQWTFWQHTDGLLILGGLATIAANLVIGWRRPVYRVIALLPLIYLLFLARGGVTFAYYIIPLIPLLALSIALCVYEVIAFIARARWWRQWTVGSWMAPAVALIALVALLPSDLQLNNTNFTANETGPQYAAIQWMGEHVPRSATIIVSHYEWLDMRSVGGLGATYGAPFDYVEMYWVVATDPAIGGGVFHNDWRNVDYIMADSDTFIDANGFHMTLLLTALRHAVPIAKFQNKWYWVTIYQVQHDTSSAASP
ncbi:MAG TPA: glycosyltransferase family 39 protein [Ktedonobacterales bacterium]